MVVDDEADIIKLTATVFELHNHMTTRTASGTECLEQLEAGTRPDVILMDIMMPELNGFETCLKIKADPRFKSIPVVILSAKPKNEVYEKGMLSGASGYISKPFDPYDLVRQVEAVYKSRTLV
jgi:two-component system chemotaxis sensor kinase CheA